MGRRGDNSRLEPLRDSKCKSPVLRTRRQPRSRSGYPLPGPSNAFVSRGWREYTGLSAEETEGFGWQSIVHPEDLQRHMQNWRVCSATGEPLENEVRYRSTNGEYRWFLDRAVPLSDEHGNVVKWYGVLTDIEDRKRAEQALIRSEAYLAEAQRLSHTGSWAASVATGKTTHWSEEMFRIHGVDPRTGPADRDAFFAIVHPEDRDRLREASEQAWREKTELAHYYRIVLPDGTLRHIQAIGHPVLDGAGELVEYVGT